MILLIRPHWVKGESWGGYLLRLSENNGLNGLKSLSRKLGLTVMKLMSSSPHELLPRLRIHQQAPALQTQLAVWPTVKKIRLHTAGRSLYSRVCPLCLSQDKYPHIPSIWNLALNLVCKIHNRCLLDTCPNCSKPIDFLRSSIVRCACGQDFRLIDMPMAPDHLQRLEHVFGVEPIRANASGTFAQADVTERYGVFSLRRMLNLSDPVNCLIDQRTYGHSYTQIFRLADLKRVSEWFIDWPHGFLRGIQIARASFLSAEQSFRPKTILIAHAFPIIKDVLDFEANELGRRSDENHRRVVLASPNQAPPKDVVDIQTISKITGCKYKVVVVWIKGGALGEVVTYADRNGNRRYEIDGQKAREVAQFFAHTSTISRLANMVGTESRALHRLALAKIFPINRVSPGTRLARVHPKHVLEIAKRLIGSATHDAATPDSALSFSQALLRLSQSTPQEIRIFMDDLGTDALPLVCREENPTRLDDVLMNVKDWRHWRTLQLQKRKI